MLRISVAFVAVLLAAVHAGAQSKGYVQGGLMHATQPAGTANHRVQPPLGGSAIPVSVAGGVFTSPTVALEGEFVVGGVVSKAQQFSYNWREDYIAESRDMLMVLNARWRPVARRPFELVGGGGVAISRFANRSIVTTYTFAFPPRPPTMEPDEVSTSAQLVLGGGVSAPLSVSRRIEVVPAFTVRWVGRSTDGLGGYAGVGSWAYVAGASVRVGIP